MSSHNTRSNLLHVLLSGLLRVISLLPLKVLYIFSNGFYFIIYYVVRYRRKLVRKNLSRSFPEKSAGELTAIEKQFYRHFSDLAAEIIKQRTMSVPELKRRCVYTGASVELLDHYYAQGKSIIIVMGHKGNWEWAGASYPLWHNHRMLAAYHPVSSEIFDVFMKQIRTQTGVIPVPMKTLPKEMLARRSETNAVLLISDQTPSSGANAYWTSFLNQETPYYKGPEFLSKKLNLGLFWARVNKVRRGHYEVDIQLITDDPLSVEREGELTKFHSDFLERDIKDSPETWLWSHRRWKHTRPEGMELIS